MILLPKAALLALLLVVAAPGGAPAAAGHYVPVVGDSFSYAETIVIDQGTGNYSGYLEHDWINGTETVTGVAVHQTVSVYYVYVDHWTDNSPAHGVLRSPTAANYTFSAVTYRYVSGTDNQTGYTNPSVWFYMNNSLAVGDAFTLLNTPFTVESRDQSYPYSGSATGYVATIAADGSGSYERDDDYGEFTATYTWDAYFDPGTGYIVGYLYTEHDTNGVDGFTWTDQLVVTHTSYPLTSAPAPPSGGGSPSNSGELYLAIGIVVVVVIVIVVAAVLASRRRPSLPRHSGTGQVAYAPVPPPPPGPAPPPIGLTPSGQPAVQQIVMRETVKVNCRYCGTLIDTTATVCPNCGAPRT